MSNSFTNAIVRGAGFTIGRSLVDGLIRPSKVSSNKYYERAENELEKALNFPIHGRSNTILGRCFNMYQEFESELRTTGGVAFDLLMKKSKILYYTECLEKIKDCKEYLELVNEQDPNIAKLDGIEEKINIAFSTWVNKISERILTLKSEKDLKIAIGSWDKENKGFMEPYLRPLYIQTTDNPAMILEIDDYLKNVVITEEIKNEINNKNETGGSAIVFVIIVAISIWVTYLLM